jgi:hypothetical protein
MTSFWHATTRAMFNHQRLLSSSLVDFSDCPIADNSNGSFGIQTSFEFGPENTSSNHSKSRLAFLAFLAFLEILALR